MSDSYHLKNGAYQSDGNSLKLGAYERIIESFDYETEKLDDHYNETFRFETRNNNVSHGSRALYHKRTDHNQMWSMPGDGKSYYPQIGDTIAIDMTADEGGSYSYFSFFKEDGDTGYEMRISKQESSVQLVDGEVNQELLRLGIFVNTDRYYTLKVNTWKDNGNNVFDISYRPPGSNSGSPSGGWVGPWRYVDEESLYDGRGFGFGGQGYGYHDYMRVL